MVKGWPFSRSRLPLPMLKVVANDTAPKKASSHPRRTIRKRFFWEFIVEKFIILPFFWYPTYMRLFIAITLPEDLKESIARVLDRLIREAEKFDAEVKWTK